MTAAPPPAKVARRLRRWGIRARATLAFGAGAALVSATLALVTFSVVRHDLLDQRETSGLRQVYVNARLVKQELEPPSGDVAQVLSSLGTPTGVRSLIYRNHLWFSTSASIGEQQIPRSLVQSVLEGHAAEQLITVNGEPAFAVGIPIPAAGVTYFEVHTLTELQGTLATLAAVLASAAAAVAVGGALLGAWVSRRLVRPLSGMAKVAIEIADGAYERRLPADPDLGPLVGSFNHMVGALQTRIDRDARFAADLSHELRSPLTTLTGSVELVESYREVLPADGQMAIDLLQFETQRFQQMVQDLLEISRMDGRSADLSFETFPISELVARTVAGHPSDVPVEVEPSTESVAVLGDKRRLQRVVVNLLDNAQAHAGGATLVSVIRRQALVEVAVEDRGPGVAPAEQGRIFERFYRGEASGRRASTGGAGLGLALVAEHVRAHRGEVRIENRPGGGARFVVVLPVVQS